jgi:putative peptide zinc metalloprotease protein
MSTTAEPPLRTAGAPREEPPLDRATGIELLGEVHGSGYERGAALVRRADGQMVQLGSLMYAVLDAIDGRRGTQAVADAASETLGRRLDPEHVDRLAEKLSGLGLLAGSEANAPPKVNPLLALRWKVLVTDPKVTARITRPFTFLFRPWLMWPILAAFAVVCWFVLVHKGVASATAQAFHSPGLLLLVFALAVASAGFHEIGHAAACRYGGAAPRGMGMGLYVVWPAFYTDVTDAYRLPRRARLRTDLGGLYFNAVVAVATLGLWLAVRVDALLLLIAIQLIEMVKQLSPVFRADGYHILADATGVPDLYAHIGPTLRRLLPWAPRESSALTGRARLLVTVWVLIVVPVLLSLAISAIVLLPRLAATAWGNGRSLAESIPGAAGDGRIIDVLSALLQLLALALPVAGGALMAQRIVRSLVGAARSWSKDRPARKAAVIVAGACAVAGAAYAWWPAGQYRPVRAQEDGTLTGLVGYVTSPRAAPNAKASAAGVPQTPVHLKPGKHLAVAMIPVGGASKQHPALFVIKGQDGEPTVAVLSPSAPDPSSAPTSPGATAASSSTAAPAPAPATATATPAPSGGGSATTATAFPFKLPEKPGPGDTQALAVNTKDGAVLYDVAYSVVTVRDGSAVTNENSAYALASCRSCTTVAVSFQVVLVIGQSNVYLPANVAEALNVNCPACVTTALAEQIVVTLRDAPSAELLAHLNAELQRLNAVSTLGSGGDATQQLLTIVASIKHDIDAELDASGLLTSSSSSGTAPPPAGSTTTTGAPAPAAASTTPAPASTVQTTPAPTATSPTQTTTTDAPAATPTTSTTSTTQTTETTDTTTTTPAQTTTDETQTTP